MDTPQNGKWMLKAEKMYTVKERNCQQTTANVVFNDPNYFHGTCFPYTV